MVQHRAMYKRWQTVEGAKNVSVFRLFEKYGMDGCRIVLVELCPCDTRDELLKREAHHMKLFECVNKNRPIITMQDKADYGHKYHRKADYTKHLRSIKHIKFIANKPIDV